jgi:glycosyltransferase involved in cell wall biosynthesis
VNQPVISIGIVCHNYGHYIARAIDSVLAQKMSFSFELIIADDASSDNSREIITSYAARYPGVIRIIMNEKNQGPVYCARELMKEAKGKYIAWLDADDYWSCEEKLQHQIGFLETHPDYLGCFHDSEIISEMSSEENNSQSLNSYRYYSQFNHYSPDFEPLQLLMRNIIPTASLVFRNRDFSAFFSSFNLPVQSFSWAFQLEIIKAGKFRYFNKPWSVYNDHAFGLSKKLTSESFSLNNIRILKRLKRDPFYRRYRNRIWQSIAHEYECIVYSNGIINTAVAYKSQCSYFSIWWWTAWYYKMEILKKIFCGRK